MPTIQRREARAARVEFLFLLAAAASGRTTIITRRGRSVAALVPVKSVAIPKQRPLTGLAGSGRGLWSRDRAAATRRLRDD